ncbi:hypothetical protein ACWGF3_38945 [Streptomyces xanthophaeus]|uniref:Lipoprotein n=1 Tax=Streptomyces xanthophaeus TaxID=67385 RepID=A0A919GWG8_9ACTN|nr:hypothetical protein [Streptomyces xanthophaeus]GHI86172.1 hypothetical protein Sxan_35360 [Streptomyces xanthophaeus]
MPPPDRWTHIRSARAALAVLCTVLLYGGCAGKPAADTPPATLEEIAAAIGCTAEVSVQADELRQGGCGTGPDAYRMATFAADEGLKDWLTEAQAYGGTYLVGNRWVVTARSEQALTALRGRLGGSLENGASHGEHPSDPPPEQPAAAPSGSSAESPAGSPAVSPTGPHSGH